MIWLLAGALQFAVFWGSLNFKIPPLHEPNCKDLWMWCFNTQQLRFAPTCQDREDIGERYRCKFLKTDFGSSNINMARNNSLYYYSIRNQSQWYSWFSASRMDDLECGQSQTSVIQWTWRVKKGEEDQKVSYFFFAPIWTDLSRQARHQWEWDRHTYRVIQRRTTWPLHSIWLFLRMVLTEEELAMANMRAKTDNRINSALLLRGKTNNFVEQASCDREIQRALFCSPTRSSSAYSFNCSVVHEPWKFSEVK